MGMKMRSMVLVALLTVVGASCGEQRDEASPEPDDAELALSIGSVPDKVEGNVVSLPVDVEGLELVKADGDKSGDTGHLHVFIDKEPVGVGDAIPQEAGIVHSADNPVLLYGLAVGEHEITVVAGNGAHERLGEVSDSVTVEVEGPSVDATAPRTIEEGDDLEIGLEAEGVEIKAPDGDDSQESGHFHVLVDPATPPKAGDTIPAAKEGEIYHSPEDSVTIKGLAKGDHTLFVVVGDGNHKAFEPAVMDKLTVTVG